MSATFPPAPPPADTDRICGPAAVAALFAVRPEAVLRLFYMPSRRREAGGFCKLLAAARKPYREVPADELARIAGTTHHGGIVAIAAARSVPDLAAPFPAALLGARVLPVLDGIGNPHNLGAIARTAAFFGLPHLAISDRQDQAGPSEAAYRVSEGGLVWVDLYRIHRLPDVLRRLRDFYIVVGTALDGAAPLPVAELAKAPKPVCLVLGNEERGLSPETLAACEKVAMLPGSGRVQSLNVAATAAIFMHALTGGLRPR